MPVPLLHCRNDAEDVCEGGEEKPVGIYDELRTDARGMERQDDDGQHHYEIAERNAEQVGNEEVLRECAEVEEYCRGGEYLAGNGQGAH